MKPRPAPAADKKRLVAVTGAAGNIGRSFTASASGRYVFRLLCHPKEDATGLDAHGTVHKGDITDDGFMDEGLDGVDTVVHLAANPSPDTPWEDLLRNNIIGTRTVVQAAIRHHVRRFVFASSIHAVSGYPPGRQVHADEPVSPGDEYGVTKCFGEAMARYAATQHGVSSLCIRIGSFQPPERAERSAFLRFMNSFVSRRDLDQLIARCIDDDELQFAIFHGLSNNRFNRMEIETARELVGYDPQDDFTELNEDLADLALREVVQPHDESH
jgi:nucleoside-diphosphate-sugar epimerase